MSFHDETRTELRITYAHQIKPHRQRWLWAPEGQGVIPLGTGTIAAGAGGEGKSTFMLHVAAQLTRGTLPGDLNGQAHPVIVFGPEDDWPTVMVPRLIAAGADLERVAQVQAATVTEFHTAERELKFPLDLTLLREAVDQTGARMVIVDPAPSLMEGDMNRVQEVRRAYEPLMSLAQDKDLAIVLINHFGKGAGNVGAKLSGSHAWRDLTRSYLAFATDPETDERILTQDKNNYGTGRGSWKFALESKDVDTEDGPANVGAVRFLGASELTVGDLINRDPGEPGETADDRNELDTWLIEVLTEAGGSMAVRDLKAAARDAGYEFKTLQNRRSKIANPRVTSGRNGFGKGSVPFWQIEETPIDPEETPIHPIHPEAGTYGTYAAEPGTYAESGRTPAALEAPAVESGTELTGTAEGAPPQESDGGRCQKFACQNYAADGSPFCDHHTELRRRVDTALTGEHAA